MNSKYQKYYDGLKGKDFASNISKYNSTLSTVKSKIDGIEATIASEGWSEKGLEIIKSSIIPSLKEQEKNAESGVTALSGAVSKVSDLLSKLESLKSACSAYDSCKEEEKSSYKNKINSLEKEADAIISEINAIGFEFNDKSSDYSGYIDALKEMTSLASLKAEFLGDVNDTSKYYVDQAYAHKAKELVMFDNTTGEILKEGDVLRLKPGETRVLTVRLPYNAGAIDKIVRTTADGDSAYRSGQIVTAKSDVNPDPNVIDYVNYKSWSGHIPAGVDLHTNYYDWVITANAEGAVTVSQTCEYTTTNGNTPKAMTDLKVIVG